MDDRLIDVLCEMIISLIPHVDIVALFQNDEDRKLFLDALVEMVRIREETKRKSGV